MKMGMMVTINQSIDQDTALIVVEELGHIGKPAAADDPEAFLDEGVEAVEAEALPRPPVVTVMGHVDHGKTTLTAAITTVLARRLLHQLTNQKTMRLSMLLQKNANAVSPSTLRTLSTKLKKRHYAHIDAPGHADYVKNMITGAAQWTEAILVVASTDGPMPQTREHILLSRQVGVKHLIVFMNKVDLVDDEELLELVEMEIRDLLSDTTSQVTIFQLSKVQLLKLLKVTLNMKTSSWN